MPLFGLTGNMGCGKSTVAAILAQFSGIEVIDSDTLAKQVIYVPENWSAISAILGKNVFATGKPDYKAIGNIFFGDNERKKTLEKFAGPLLWSAIQERVVAQDVMYVVESALLFESRLADRFDGVIVATCLKKEQYRRLLESRKMTRAEIWARLRYQVPNVKKIDRADFVIHTDGTFDELSKKVDTLAEQLKQWKGKGCEKSSVRRKL